MPIQQMVIEKSKLPAYKWEIEWPEASACQVDHPIILLKLQKESIIKGFEKARLVEALKSANKIYIDRL